MDLGAQATNKEIYEKWLTEDFILDEIERAADQEDRMVKLFEYLQLLDGYNNEVEE